MMQIKVRPLNIGEMYSCSISKAKAIFKNTDIYLNFAYLGRTYETFARTPDAFYIKKHIRGRILASMYAHTGQSCPILSFYVVKDIDYPQDARVEFEEVYLPKYYEFYQSVVSGANGSASEKMLVELYRQKLHLHVIKM